MPYSIKPQKHKKNAPVITTIGQTRIERFTPRYPCWWGQGYRDLKMTFEDQLYDTLVLLGTPGVNQTKKPVRVVGYRVDKVNRY